MTNDDTPTKRACLGCGHVWESADTQCPECPEVGEPLPDEHPRTWSHFGKDGHTDDTRTQAAVEAEMRARRAAELAARKE